MTCGSREIGRSAELRLVAVDGVDLNGPTPVRDTSVEVTSGGRADLEIVMPGDGTGVRVALGGSAAVVLGRGAVAPAPRPERLLDLLSYGSPAPLGLDPAAANRRFEYVIGRRPGFLDGLPGLWWTVNGRLFPDVPMFVVAEGDVVTARVSNAGGEVHPMHLHGHHAVVMARDGSPRPGARGGSTPSCRRRRVLRPRLRRRQPERSSTRRRSRHRCRCGRSSDDIHALIAESPGISTRWPARPATSARRW